MPRTRFAHGILLLIPWLTWAAPAPASSTVSVVIFNTACARCHEGECSGRLSFSGTAQDTFNHIARHYPPAAGAPGMQRELHTILDYMKSECAFYPLEIRPPSDRRWDAESLVRLSIPAGTDYFIPLGRLASGTYRLALTTREEGRVSLQLLDERFDWLVDTCRDTGNRQLEIDFEVTADSQHYLRILSRDAGRLTGLALHDVTER